MRETLPIREATRLPDYDYSTPGAYFVTVCCQSRKRIWGKIDDSRVELSDFGNIVAETWRWLSSQYEYVELDEFVIMPDHFHGILIIKPDMGVGLEAGGSRTAPTSDDEDRRGRSRTTRSPIKRKTLGRLIGAFKTVSTKRINELRKTPGAKIGNVHSTIT